MGFVTQREADAAVELTRTTSGVKKVINVMEIITDAKAKELDVSPPENRKQAEPSAQKD
jgi:hypothetical protein